MSKFERVLSDELLTEICIRMVMADSDLDRGEAESIWVDIKEDALSSLREIEQGILSGLAAEKEPVAWFIDDKRVCGNRIIIDLAIAKDWLETNPDKVTPLYAHPMPSSQVNLDSSNHIADKRKMVADMYWINPDYPSYTSILDAFEPITLSVEVEIGDQFEVSRAKTLPALTIEVTELEENGDVKDYKVLGGDHIADANKMVPEGWQLVPVEPIEEMLKKAFPEIFDIDGISKNDLIERYQAMLAEAPKYTGDSNE